MKKLLKILILLILVGAIVYSYKDSIRPAVVPIINDAIDKLGIAPLPCSSPLPYTLGTFDARFSISQKYFLSALTDAEKIWEKPFDRELFDYKAETDKTNILKINLVYDYRQEATSKLASLGIVVKDNRASYDALKIKFNELKTKLAAANDAYDAKVQSFNARQKAYGQEVESWNARGGAPEAEYNKLQAEKTALDAEFSLLQQDQAKINAMVDEVNAFVVVLNRLATTLNLSVEDYNTVGASRGESFEEGVYVSDGINEEIDIYEFNSREKLVRVLAHELGHALGLDHVDDAKAIMYKLNQGNSQALTAADLSALKTKCVSK